MPPIRTAILLASILLLPRVASAQAAAPFEPDFTGVTERPLFWAIETEKDAKYRQLMKRGDQLSTEAVNPEVDRDTMERRQYAELAMLAYEGASRLAPKRAEPHARAAFISRMFQTEDPYSTPSAIDREIAHLDAFERLAPGAPEWASRLYFRRGILHTMRNKPLNLEQGVLDYDRGLELTDQSDPEERTGIARTISNQAEVLMMLGRLEESIAGYQNAVDLTGELTHGFGLAVALDRDGQGFRARQVARRFALLDRTNVLNPNNGTTFFIPRAEVYYYVALRAEGLGETDFAKRAYEAFIMHVPRSRYIKQARANLKALSAKAPRGGRSRGQR